MRCVAVATAAALLGGTAIPAAAQSAATVKEIVRLVKVGRAGALRLVDARPNMPLSGGDRVRTGGRSSAGLRFADQSLLRLGELTEVVVVGGARRDARVTRGKVFASYTTPGAISGGYAVAAVRGTRVVYDQNGRRRQAEVHCFRGRVYVAGAANPILAGDAPSVTATTLTDPTLAGLAPDWVGGEVRFLSGRPEGRTRDIAAVDGSAGRITFAPALDAAQVPAAGDPPTGYLLVKRKGTIVVTLTDGMGTTVRENADPLPPYPVPQEEFGRNERFPFYREGAERELAFPGTRGHDDLRREEWPVRDALDHLCDRRICDRCGGTPLPEGLQPRAPGRRALAAALQAGGRSPDPRLPSGQGRPGALPAPGRPGDMEISEHLRGTAAPFGIVTDESTAVGSQAGLQGTWGQVYGEVVYRYLLLDGRRDRHDLSEGYLHFRTRGGDLVVGRQHLFIGPVQNNRLGSLLKLEAADAVVYQAPLRRGYRQEAGYLIDSRATRRRGYSGGYLRGQAPVRAGYAGYSVLFADTGNSRIGWSLDASQPVIPNVLDLYGEGGVGIHGRTLWTAGIYVPALYHAGKVDLFLEYSGRENSDDRASLRLRRELGSGLFVAAFADRRLRQNEWDVGAGIQWNLRYR